MTRNFALVVGINEYPQRTGQRKLAGAVADAEDFAEWALDPDGGAVGDGRLYFWTHPAPANPGVRLAQYLTSPNRPLWADELAPTRLAPADFTRAPTRRTIAETGFEAANQAYQPGVNDARLYVFFAGHGVRSNLFDTAHERQTCFVTGDFGEDDEIAHGVLPCEDFRRALLTNRFRDVIMFLDCCRGDMATLTKRVAPLIATATSQDDSQLLWVVGHAARTGEPAYEVPEINPERGAFSRTLLQGLRTARTSRGELTLNLLRDHVRRTIGPIVEPKKQAPQFRTENPDDEIVLLTNPHLNLSTAEIVFRFGPAIAADADFVLRDRDTNIVDQFKPGAGVRSLQPVGRPYSVECRALKIAIAFDHPGPGETNVPI